MMGILQDLDLLHASLLFLSRETIRMALLRNTNSIQLAINFSYVPLVVFSCLAIGFGYFASDLSTFVYIIAAGIEILSEPFFIYCQSQLQYAIRVVSATHVEIGRTGILYSMYI